MMTRTAPHTDGDPFSRRQSPELASDRTRITPDSGSSGVFSSSARGAGPVRTARGLGHVMLVDDEEIDRRMYERLLRRSATCDSIAAFGYAADALAHLSADVRPPVDLILLDINMPGMNGFEFLDKLTHLCRHWPIAPAVIIMLTTSLNPAAAERAISCHLVRACICKPLGVSGLSEIERAVSDKSRSG